MKIVLKILVQVYHIKFNIICHAIWLLLLADRSTENMVLRDAFQNDQTEPRNYGT